MPDSKNTPCSICGQTIQTVRGAVRMTNAPLVCRRCFGEGSYTTPNNWKFPVTGAEANADN